MGLEEALMRKMTEEGASLRAEATEKVRIVRLQSNGEILVVTPELGRAELKKIGERTYEELEASIAKAKRKQYESVITAGMSLFVEDMEKEPTLKLQAIIDQNGGVENVARGLAEELEVILPSTWSKADQKLFAFIFTKKQIEDLFE